MTTMDTAVVPAQRPAADDGTAVESWALVERAQAGDMDAFGDLYRRYQDTIFRYVCFRVGNRQLAEDITSETFVRALKSLPRFVWQGRDFGAWLVTIARNLTVDTFKSGRHRLEITTGEVLNADRADQTANGIDPAAAVIENITNQLLLDGLARLNPEQRTCLVLRFLQQLSVAETAAAMGREVGAIKALQYRAVRSLTRLTPALQEAR